MSKTTAAALMAICVSAITFPTASFADAGSLTWTKTIEVPQYWSAIAASYDGNNLVAGSVTGGPTPPDAYHGKIYTSDDSGVTWIPRQPNRSLLDWRSVASSSDGQKLVVCWTDFDGEGQIYTSVDSGVTWRLASAPARNWVAVTSSADGNKLAAAASGDEGTSVEGEIYTSVDAGATWVLRTSAGLRQWTSIASDSSGNKLVAADRRNEFGTPNPRGYIYTSSNAGLTWIQHDAPQSAGLSNTEYQSWNSVTSNGDGSKLAAGGLNGLKSFGGIFISSDSGATWTENSPIENERWASVSMSNSGKNIIASPIGGYLYVSNDYGETWTAQTSSGIFNWASSVVSRDGSLLIAGENEDSMEPGGYLWTTSLTAEPTDDSDAIAEAARVAAAEAARVAAAEAARVAAAEAARVAAAEAARVAALNAAIAAEAAKRTLDQKQMSELLSVIPSIAGLALNIGGLTNSLLAKQKCVKGKTTKYVKKGARCPKGYVKRK